MSEENAAAESTNAAESTPEEKAEKLYGDSENKDEANSNEEPQGESKEEEKSEDSEESNESKEDSSGESEEDKDKEEESDDEEKSSDKQESKAPDKYDFEVDDDDPITDETLGKIAQYAKSQGLSNKEAQKLVDIQSNALKDYREELDEGFKGQVEQWKADAKKDPEIGGDNFNKNVQLAKNAIDRFGSEKLREELVTLGYANHPELVRVFSKVGAAMANDSLVKSNAQSKQEKTPEQMFYGDS